MHSVRKKSIDTLLARAEGDSLHREMGLGSLILFGVGGTIGAGIFVLTGTAAAQYAGPAVALSFILASLACLCAGLCYAELSSALPVAGSAYIYSRVAFGEVVGWLVAWGLILEYLFSVAVIAIGWSGYLATFLAEHGLTMPRMFLAPALGRLEPGGSESQGANVVAAALVVLLSLVLASGLKRSKMFNIAIVTLKIGVILLVIVIGAQHVAPSNWVPFVPENRGGFGEFGWSGVLRATGLAFFAFIGFDMVSSGAQETKNPQRNIPIGLIATLAICTILYVGMCLVMTGLAPYPALNTPDPLLVALSHAGPELAWLKTVVGVSVIIGLFAAIMLGLFGQSRIFYAMAKDGLLPVKLAEISRNHVPGNSIALAGGVAAILAAMVPMQLIAELASMGTISAFMVVCGATLYLRKTEPDLRRPFRVPMIRFVAISGIGICCLLLASLPGVTWIFFLSWLIVGGLIYLIYGRRHAARWA